MLSLLLFAGCGQATHDSTSGGSAGSGAGGPAGSGASAGESSNSTGGSRAAAGGGAGTGGVDLRNLSQCQRLALYPTCAFVDACDFISPALRSVACTWDGGCTVHFEGEIPTLGAPQLTIDCEMVSGGSGANLESDGHTVTASGAFCDALMAAPQAARIVVSSADGCIR